MGSLDGFSVEILFWKPKDPYLHMALNWYYFLDNAWIKQIYNIG
jgi:hypothetical protein